MAISLSENHVRMLRLHSQRLAARQTGIKTSVARLVSELCGVQAQDARAATLAIRVRSAGLVAADVERALTQERSIVRTWGLRGTLHLLPADDFGWLLQLFGPVFIEKNRRRRAELGLDEATCTRGIKMLRTLLANQGPLTRDELMAQMALHGLQLVGLSEAGPHSNTRIWKARQRWWWHAASSAVGRGSRGGNMEEQASEEPLGSPGRAV